MKVTAERFHIDAAFDAYRARLDRITDDQFDLSPPGGGWSYAEVYSHILQATLGSTIAAEKCSQSGCKPTDEKTTWLGKLVLMAGRFPPFPVKTPQTLNQLMPAKKITKEDARNLIIRCRQRVDAIVPLINKAPKNCRIAHPRLGMMNALQWLKFTRIHLQHHLKQIDRIGELLK